MARLIWNQMSQRRHEAGVDHGVLYPLSGPGVVWNGLIAVEESFAGGETSSYYFDGIKYLDLASPKNFQAAITAFSAPAAFASAIGDRSIIPGFILTRQPRVRFGLSYRTLIGDGGYKLHLVYNALASATQRGYASIADAISATTLSWQIDATPPRSNTYRPSAHFVLDSTKVSPDAMRAIEDVLYGTLTRTPRLPSVDELIDRISFWDPVIVIPQNISGLPMLEHDHLDMEDINIYPNPEFRENITAGRPVVSYFGALLSHDPVEQCVVASRNDASAQWRQGVVLYPPAGSFIQAGTPVTARIAVKGTPGIDAYACFRWEMPDTAHVGEGASTVNFILTNNWQVIEIPAVSFDENYNVGVQVVTNNPLSDPGEFMRVREVSIVNDSIFPGYFSGDTIDTERFRGVAKRALVYTIGGGWNLNYRLESFGWAVTHVTTEPTLDEIKQYDLFGIDSGYNGIPNQVIALAASAYDAGVSIFTTGNDTTTVTPLTTGSASTTSADINTISPVGTHPCAQGWASYGDTDNNIYYTGVRSTVVVVGTASLAGSPVPLLFVEQNPNGNNARWAHVQTYASVTPTQVTQAFADWLSEPRGDNNYRYTWLDDPNASASAKWHKAPRKSEEGDLSKTKVAGIYRDLPNTRLTKTATSGLYRLELE